MKTKLFAGIGSRNTPDSILKIMRNISAAFTQDGYTLVSGNAEGADQAFEEVSLKSIIYKAEDASSEALKMAESYHPHWKVCSPYARRLLARNCHIILGPDLKAPVDFVVCWTPDAKIIGGTGQSLRIAMDHNIKIYNLADEGQYRELREFYKTHVHVK